MRVVSWNKKSHRISSNAFAKMLKAASADVVVVQEPSGGVAADGWKFVTLTGESGTGQDSYVVGVRSGGQIDHCYLKSDPRSGGRPNGENRAFVVAQVTVGSESLTLVSCHAPHSGGTLRKTSDEARDFMQALGVRLGRTAFRATDAKTSALPPEVMADPPPPIMADLFMGDTNLYDPHSAGGKDWCPATWKSPDVGRTTCNGGDTGHPLDRIAFRQAATSIDQEVMSYGRIRVGDGEKAPPKKLHEIALRSKADPLATHKKDLWMATEEDDYTGARKSDKWEKSDHLAIYFDTGKGGDAVMPDAPVEAGRNRSGLKRGAAAEPEVAIPAAAGVVVPAAAAGASKKPAPEKKDTPEKKD